MTGAAFLVEGRSKRALENAASRPTLGLVESGRAEVDAACSGGEVEGPWVPCADRHACLPRWRTQFDSDGAPRTDVVHPRFRVSG